MVCQKPFWLLKLQKPAHSVPFFYLALSCRCCAPICSITRPCCRPPSTRASAPCVAAPTAVRWNWNAQQGCHSRRAGVWLKRFRPTCWNVSRHRCATRPVCVRSAAHRWTPRLHADALTYGRRPRQPGPRVTAVFGSTPAPAPQPHRACLHGRLSPPGTGFGDGRELCSRHRPHHPGKGGLRCQSPTETARAS